MTGNITYLPGWRTSPTPGKRRRWGGEEKTSARLLQYVCSPPRRRSLARLSVVIISSWRWRITQMAPTTTTSTRHHPPPLPTPPLPPLLYICPRQGTNSKASRTKSHLCICRLHPKLVSSNTSVIPAERTHRQFAGAIMAITQTARTRMRGDEQQGALPARL